MLNPDVETTANEDSYNQLAGETRKYLPGPTCPEIDSVISDINDCQKYIGRADRYETGEALAGELDYYLRNLSDPLNKLRRDNETLREYSQAWRELAEDYLKQLTALEKQGAPTNA